MLKGGPGTVAPKAKRSKVYLSRANILPFPSCFQIFATPNNSFILCKSGGLRRHLNVFIGESWGANGLLWPWPWSRPSTKMDLEVW